MPLRMQKFATDELSLGMNNGRGANGRGLLATWLQSSIGARPITSEDALFITVLAISASPILSIPSGALTSCDTCPRPLLRYYLPSPLAGRGLNFVYEKTPASLSCHLDQVSDQDIRERRRGSIDRAEPKFPEGISW